MKTGLIFLGSLLVSLSLFGQGRLPDKSQRKNEPRYKFIQISFNYCPVDSCQRYNLTLKPDSFRTEMRVAGQLRGSNRNIYAAAPDPSFAKLYQYKESDFAKLSGLTRPAHKSGYLEYIIEYTDKGKMQRFEVSGVPEKSVRLRRREKQLLRNLTAYSNYFVRRASPKAQEGIKLKNF